MARKAKIEICNNATLGVGPYWYRVKARNGEILVFSEGFIRHADARRAARRLLLLLNSMTIDDIVDEK